MLRIAQVKVYPEKGDLESNYQSLLSLLEELPAYRPDVVITPECFLDGYISTDKTISAEDIGTYAIDPANSPYAQGISRWAAKNSAWFVFGCTRAAPEGNYNTALIFDRGGNLAGLYDKVHCQAHDKKYRPGNSLPVFSSDFGPFGVMICADRRWPETVRSLALKGARIIFNPTYGMHDERNLHMMQTRSYESEVFIAFTHPAQALVTGPRGEIVCNMTDEVHNFAIVEVDLSEVDRIRSSEHSHLKDRRPEVYMLEEQGNRGTSNRHL